MGGGAKRNARTSQLTQAGQHLRVRLISQRGVNTERALWPLGGLGEEVRCLVWLCLWGPGGDLP